MSFYIREMPDKSAMLITREGRRLFNFKDVESALLACRDWYGIGTQQVIADLLPSPGHNAHSSHGHSA